MSRSIADDFKTELPSKRMKNSVVEGTLVNITQPKKIVDIITDCLESVFEFLEFSDLINVAEANKQLKVTAEIVFVRKLKKRMFVVDNDGILPSIEISSWDNAIHTYNPLLGFKIIRLFGQYMSEIYLRIDIFQKNSSLRKFFFIHVNEYCHKSLNILHIFGDHSNLFGVVKHLFRNVEKFTYENGLVGAGSEHINRLFPHLRQLTLNDNFILDSKCILRNSPNVRTFTLFYGSEGIERPHCFMESDLKTVAALNPQIQDLTLKGNVKLRIWEYMNTKLKDLKRICLSYSQDDVEKSFIGPRILFNNVEIFDVSCLRQGTPVIVKPIDVFSFKRLRKLKLKCHVKYGQMEMWLDFVLAHPTIEEFEVFCIDGFKSWPKYLKTFENLHEKLNKVRRNTKFISLRLYETTFDIDNSSGKYKYIKEIPTFLGNQQWFDKFSVVFPGSLRFIKTKMKDFSEKIPQIKNYKMKKKLLIFILKTQGDYKHEISIDFEKCES